MRPGLRRESRGSPSLLTFGGAPGASVGNGAGVSQDRMERLTVEMDGAQKIDWGDQKFTDVRPN